MAYTFQVAMDSADPHGLADWWADALGWTVEPSDPDFIRQMIAEGHASEADTTTHHGVLVWRDGAAVVDPDKRIGSPRLFFQLVPERKTVKNRMHLDLRVSPDAPAAVVDRLVAAGATRLHDGRQGPHTWVTLADPEGNEFCVSA
ncbi:VOC family protein [Jatrophihabitans endophyticus]|uniref:VOC family protein n=1 Tax=Jatrophihabitans endophyticus TaxID=1206085 RepID=UPI0019DF1DFE|nr:VOC family protein [Jatrophihabitans endophyticus]MBE7188244.1 VOC family protein [Jatrophihabitans endophyticus]